MIEQEFDDWWATCDLSHKNEFMRKFALAAWQQCRSRFMETPEKVHAHDEAIETLRYLRDQAEKHWGTLNNWLIIDLVDQALKALGDNVE